MIKEFHVMELECDTKHFFPRRLNVKKADRSACLAAIRAKGWLIRRRKRQGEASCPKCARPRAVFQEFPDERS